ncbi:tetraspanin-14 [Lingula anatina]|uniref:Tetraspanin n=1 Tax=Lingula anatina TaxID=7574 RepID=A0A1S3ICA3_LINAN|nr:tetraspanin-14 [Lingula anatina]|eukprot:XP_013395491.1 tetraspanin-14 [Lingula anatina]
MKSWKRTRVQHLDRTFNRRHNQPYRENRVNGFVKYSMFFFNVLFWLVGGTLSGTSLWAISFKVAEKVAIATELNMDPFLVPLIVGAFMFTISFFGCVGSLRENECMLKMFAYSLAIILVLEAVLSFVLVFYKDAISEHVEKSLCIGVKQYMDDPDWSLILDSVQKDLQCCGVNGFADWEINEYFNCTSPGIFACSVPHSCCRAQTTELPNYLCGVMTKNKLVRNLTMILTEGCMVKIDELINENSWIVIGVTIGLVSIQVLAIVFARKIICHIEMVKANW